jgi:tetratricopeptide (TPR) repeat protein
VLVAVGVAAGSYFISHRRPTLTNRDTLVVADFVNTTGDPVFDGTLRRGLSVQLGQSPFLSLVSEERIQRTLALMSQPPDAPLTSKLAHEICQRTASAAVLDGSIASLGSQYVLGLRAKSCRSEEVLDEQQVQAARKEEVLDALSHIAVTFRNRVGESLATLESHDTPLAEATTTSLEALKAFSTASKVILGRATDLPAAVPLFKRAIEIDPQFAMAHASLGLTYGLIGEFALSAESNRKAYELRDRVSDRERFFITATYELLVTGNLEKALETCELWMRTYPRNTEPYGYLGAFLYPTFGQFDKGTEVARKLVELDPDFPIGYLQLGFNSQFAGRVQEAERVFARAAERKLDLPEIAIQRYDIAFLKADSDGMEREVAHARGTPGEDQFTARQGFVLAYSGHLEQARVKSRRAVDVAQQARQPGRAALWETGGALRDAFVGDAPAARRGATAALALSTDRDVEYGAALALALAGDSSRAEALATDLTTRFPEDSSVRFNYVPTIRAVVALNQSRPAEAIELLRAAVPYELGTPLSSAPGFYGILYPVYVRGVTYMAAHQSAEAATEFQKILDRRPLVVSDPIAALAPLQLGRALAMSGDEAKARTAYRDFLTRWKDADQDIPILAQARAEYAKLP